jgi:hypothetical protein
MGTSPTSYREIAARRFQSSSIEGDGQYAVVACAGMRDPVGLAFPIEDVSEAYAFERQWNDNGCGSTCKTKRHGVSNLAALA